ncbi:MAG: PAS domain S-box protein [Chloroflexaceae bacterium]|nr:PAS domain S-box protein [Chloroflexaceae bacterium]
MKTSIKELQAENEALKRRVAELEAQFAQTQRIVAELPHLVYVFDVPAQRNVFTNRELAETLGYTPDEIRDMGERMLAPIIHPDDLSTVIPQHFARLATAKDGEVVEVEYRLGHQSGAWHWVLARDIVFTRREDGSVWQSLGVLQDITERKEIEQQMRFFRMLVEYAPDGIGGASLDGTVTYTNPAYRRMTRWAENGGEGTGISIFEFADEPAEKITALIQQVRTQGSWQGELVANGKMVPPFQPSCRPLRWATSRAKFRPWRASSAM